VAAQHRIHVPIQHPQIARIEADDLRTDLLQAGAHALGIGWQVGRAQWAAFGIAGDAGIGLDRNHSRIEHLDEVAVRPAVAALA
jgi:hypothetical protein